MNGILFKVFVCLIKLVYRLQKNWLQMRTNVLPEEFADDDKSRISAIFIIFQILTQNSVIAMICHTQSKYARRCITADAADCWRVSLRSH